MLTERFFQKGQQAKDFFHGFGSFGEIAGDITREGNTIFHQTDAYRLCCRYTADPQGVFLREDSFQNCSEKPLEVRGLHSRFVFSGGDYEVYTQFNIWQNESTGCWQPLNTTVSVTGPSSRLCQGGTPFLALWNMQENRGVAFHLLPDSAWEMSATQSFYGGKNAQIVVELGMLNYDVQIMLAPGETLAMPRVLCYEFSNKIDMDCWKLHNYMHTHYPRREMPVIYDTWMYRFDNFNFEDIASQIAPAAELGVEYFFIDAGWFGKGANWSASVGDWSENTVTGFRGRMKELADAVRNAGIKFGLWLEPERASPLSDSVRAHPEFYLKSDVNDGYYLLDFSNPDARAWMLRIVFDLVDHYGIRYIKDDYNGDMCFDIHHSAYHAYHTGHHAFIQAIRDRYPDLYLSSCASGGMRMDLGTYTRFDSTWPSDNESPYTQFRIYKDSLLRLPPQGFERWVALHSLVGFEDFYNSFIGNNDGNRERLVACADAFWKHVEGVQMSWLRGFFSGGPIGFSFDLNLLSPAHRQALKEMITAFKEQREFWRTAVARILCDTPSVTVLQYNDQSLSRVVVQMFTHQTRQNRFCLRPVVDPTKTYRISNGQVLSGAEIEREGIEFELGKWFDNWHEMFDFTLEAV